MGGLGSACQGHPPANVQDGVLASQVVGPDGARVQGQGVTLDIPAGALPSSQQISIATSGVQPEGVVPLGPTVQLQPSGLRFAKPVTLTLQVPPGNGLVFWSALGDDKTFEFAGFAHDGVAQATNDHFSIVGSAAEEENHETEHSEPEEGDQVCDASAEAGGGGGGGSTTGGGGGGTKCLQLCNCKVDDTVGTLCPSDQGRGSGSNCPGNFAWMTSDSSNSNRVVAEGKGLACSGFRHVEVQESLCQCEGRPPQSSSDESLCAITWDQRWQCSSTATGTSSDGYEYSAETPSSSLKDRGLSAFIGTEGAACRGYYKPSMPGGPTELIDGKMTGCQQVTIDDKWAPLSGTTEACTFEDDDRVRCRLTPSQWQMLQQRRADCGFPPRSRTGEREAGPTEGRDKILITTAVLVASNGTGYPNPPITGFSSRAQRVLDERRNNNDPTVANCPPQAAIASQKEWADKVGGTAYHAEGGALLRSAEASGYTPATASSNPMGVGEMLVDRRPCPLFCRPGGIDKARRAAGLEKLTVHSPGGCLVFTEAAPRGIPCP